MRNECSSEHAFGGLGGFFRGSGNPDATGVSRGRIPEATLAPASSMNLGLDHPDWAREFPRGAVGLFWRKDHATLCDRDAVFTEEILRLMFMNVHWRSAWLKYLKSRGKGGR